MPTIISNESPMGRPCALKQAVKDLARANSLYAPTVKVVSQYTDGGYTVSLRLYYREGYSGRATFRAVKVTHTTLPATPSSNVSYAYKFDDEKVLGILHGFTAKAAAYAEQSVADAAARKSRTGKLESLLQEVFGPDADIGGATCGDVTLSIGPLCANVSIPNGVVLEAATVADLRFQIGAGQYRSGLRNLTSTAFQGIYDIIAGELAAGRLTNEDVNL